MSDSVPGGVFGRSVLLLLRVTIGGLFLFAAVLKIQDPLQFYFSIKGFQLLPEHILQPLAFMVPWIEVACGLALLTGAWAKSAALVLGGMLVVFMGAILSVIVRTDIHVECGCFGDFSPFCPKGAVGWCNIGQNAVLLAIALPVMLWGAGVLSIDGALGARSAAAEGPDVDGHSEAS
jgi:uncharacterized membrane protein YphA (DoxX/SURF4 family)